MTEGPEPASVDFGSAWTRVKEHKVLQWALAYLGAALALAHGQELMATAFGWPHSVGRVVMALLVLGLPLVVTLAWYHGHKGLRHVSQGELMIVAVLIFLGAGGFLLLVEPGEDHESEASATPVGEIDASSSSQSEQPTNVATPDSVKPRLAVLPFRNLSPDPANAFFTDGIHEEILSTLAKRAPGLEVISATTMLTYRDRGLTVAEVAAELNCSHVLEGSVRREGQEVRLTLQLIDAASDQHVWTDEFDRTLTSALVLQAEVASEVAAQLAVQLVPSSALTGPRTTNPEAYDYYLKARLAWQFVNPSSTRADYDEMNRLLTAAIEIDPQFGAAYLERAIRSTVAYSVGFDPSGARLVQVREDLATARRLLGDDPNIAGADALLSSVGSSPPSETIAALASADAAGMSDGSLLIAYARILSLMGRFEESERVLERLLAVDPGNLNVLSQYQALLLRTRRPSEALKALDTMSEQFDLPVIPMLRAKVIFDYTGQIDELRTAIERHRNALDADTRLWYEATLFRFEQSYGELGRAIEASELEVLRNESAFLSLPIPIALLSGWTSLLSGDAAAAKAEGAKLLELTTGLQFDLPPLQVSQAVLLMYGQLFIGERAAALAMARQLLTNVPPEIVEAWAIVAPPAAQVLAWAGEHDEAVTVLERLAVVPAGLAPAEIARDPLYMIPLADNARYQALKARLEAQMAATQLQ